ncbi:MAG: DUF3465 domain-containing protein [Woeseiaceae bacterium]
MKKFLLIAIVLAAAYLGGVETGFVPDPSGSSSSSTGRAEQVLAEAFNNRKSNIQVQAEGRVTRILGDDNDGSRHQRFIVELETGQTLMMAHNIDLADRVASIKMGDPVEFYGVYEWNSQGGLIHWTHRDPQGHHTAGWIKHNGRTYQ